MFMSFMKPLIGDLILIVFEISPSLTLSGERFNNCNRDFKPSYLALIVLYSDFVC